MKKCGDNKYKVMITVEKEINEKDKNSYITGIDMCISSFVVDSANNVYEAPKSLLSNYDKILNVLNGIMLEMIFYIN